MGSTISLIQERRNQIANKIQSFSTRGPQISGTYHIQVVDDTLITFDVLTKLAVYIRGDYDARVDINTDSPELTKICQDLENAATQAEQRSNEGVNAMSKITEEMMECRSVEIANLIKSVEDGKTEAQNKIAAARTQKAIQESNLDQARRSLRTARDTLSTSQQKLRETEKEREDLQLAKNLSWIIPFVGAIVNSVDAIGGFERDLRNSIDQLHNTINIQAHDVANWEVETAKTENSIREATSEMDVYSHTLDDMRRLEGNCNDLLQMSQATEKQLVELKITTRKLFVITANMHSKARDTSYVTDKAEILEVILDMLDEGGLIDNKLQSKTALLLNEIKAEDTTGLLSAGELHQKMEKLRGKAITA